MKAFLRPHRFRHLYLVRFYTTKTHSGHKPRPSLGVSMRVDNREPTCSASSRLEDISSRRVT